MHLAARTHQSVPHCSPFHTFNLQAPRWRTHAACWNRRCTSARAHSRRCGTAAYRSSPQSCKVGSGIVWSVGACACTCCSVHAAMGRQHAGAARKAANWVSRSRPPLQHDGPEAVPGAAMPGSAVESACLPCFTPALCSGGGGHGADAAATAVITGGWALRWPCGLAVAWPSARSSANLAPGGKIACGSDLVAGSMHPWFLHYRCSWSTAHGSLRVAHSDPLLDHTSARY